MVKLSDQKGLSLIGVMVAVAITAVLALIVAEFSRQLVVSAKKISISNDREMIKNMIRSRTDCAQTKAKLGNTPKNLYDANNQPLFQVNNGALELGEWSFVVSSYNASNGSFVITARNRRTTEGLKPLFHPIPFSCK